MVWFLQRMLTAAEMTALKNSGKLKIFHIQHLFLSCDYCHVKGRFDDNLSVKTNNFRTNYILDVNHTYFPVPPVSLQAFHWEYDRRPQSDELKLPYTVKVGDKIIFV